MCEKDGGERVDDLAEATAGEGGWVAFSFQKVRFILLKAG
jgi:hypothetical protein